MPPAAPELVERAMVVLECDGPTDLARKLNLGPNGYQTVHRWLKGTSKPNYDQVMAILERTGWLTFAAEGANADVSVLQEVRELRHSAQRLLDRFEEQEAAQAPPAPRRKRRA